MYINPIKLAAAIMLAAAAVPGQAAVTLSFDAIPDRGTPSQFYNGGAAIDRFGQPFGSPGPAFGVSISGDAFVLEKIRACPGEPFCGSSAIPTPPSGLRALGAAFTPDASRRVTFNLASGFTGELSFWSYVSGGALADPGSVIVFADLSGLQASFNPVLAFVSLPAPTTCIFTFMVVTEVTGCSFNKHTLTFAGTARSVVVTGAFFDDVTFGSAGNGGGVPEPASWAMLIAGFGLTGGVMRRRRTALTS